jgi:hypothetical protein
LIVLSAAIDGSTASFRPSGIARYVGAGFLAIWLAGWALGEAFALTFLFMLLRSILASAAGVSWPIPGGEWIAGGAAGFALLFIVVWLALWTFGGVAALTEFLRLLFGEDRVDIQGTSIEVTRRAGPFRRVRAFDRAVIRRVRLRPKDQAVMLDTAVSSDEITRYGSVEDRKALADWLRQRLALPADSRVVDPSVAPRDWTMRIEGGSAILNPMDVRSRRIGASILWFITALLALIVLGGLQSGSPSGATIALVITALLVFCSSWVTWSEREWLARSGQLTARVRFLAWQRERSFQHGRLRINVSTDSDGDKHYRLEVHDAEGSKRIASEMNDDADVTDLGRWLSSRTGFPLT